MAGPKAKEPSPHLLEMCAHTAGGVGWGGDGMQGQGSDLSGWRMCPVQVELTSTCLQGAYGVVRLAYNESEDRHYVSLGVREGCC
jgi:hypothetical protein